MSIDSSAAAGHEITERTKTSLELKAFLRWKIIPDWATSTLPHSCLIGDLQMKASGMPAS
jgi:hypothetical protein